MQGNTHISDEMIGAACDAFDTQSGDFAKASRAAMRAVLSAALAGHVVVPREPTEAMERAFHASCDEHGMVLWRHGYRAMISAAPPAQREIATPPTKDSGV